MIATEPDPLHAYADISVQCGLCDGDRAVLPLTHRRYVEKHD